MIKKLLILTLLAIPTICFSQVKSFPTADGAGAYSLGGRGGSVYHVTTLDWDAPGGLKEGLETTEPRYIVFDVSGNLLVPTSFYNLSGSQYSYITIAGQTAPRGGINIITEGFFGLTNMNHLIIRYVRFIDRSYYNGQSNWQAVNLSGNRDMIVDHVSVRYTWNTSNMVLTDNTRAEGQNNYSIQHTLNAHSGSTGVLLGSSVQRPTQAGDNTFHHNFFFNVSHRHPNTGGNGRFEIFNNYIYNWRARLSSMYNDATINMQNNIYELGPQSYITGFSGGYGQFMHQLGGNFTGGLYIEGNEFIGNNNTAINSDNWLGVFEWIGLTADESTLRLNSEPTRLGNGFTFDDISGLKADLLSDVGANKYLNEDGTFGTYIDPIDQDAINTALAGGSYPYLSVTTFSYPSSTYYPEIVDSRPPGYDTDQDGMPNAWEIANGLNPNVQDHNGYDLDANYPNIEMFLNSVDGGSPTSIPVESVSYNTGNETINVGGQADISVTVLPNNATNKGVSYSSDTPSVLNNSGVGVSAGTADITVTTNDGSFTDVKTVTVNSTTVSLTDVQFSESNIIMNYGQQEQVDLVFTPSNASDVTGAITTANGLVNVVRGGNTLTITPTGVGTDTVTFTSNDGGLVRNLPITVNAIIQPEGTVFWKNFLNYFNN